MREALAKVIRRTINPDEWGCYRFEAKVIRKTETSFIIDRDGAEIELDCYDSTIKSGDDVNVIFTHSNTTPDGLYFEADKK